MPGSLLLPKLVAAAAAGALLGAWAVEAPDVDRVERLIAEKTNQFRREQGLEALRPEPTLAESAQAFAAYMARTDRYGHEADGKTPAERARARGYDYCFIAENISYQYSSLGFTTPGLAGRYVDGWRGSPGHRKNMLEPVATDTGVAVVRGEKSGRYYAVQLFGRPRSAMVEFRVTNLARQRARYRADDREFELEPGSGRIHEHCGPVELELKGAATGSQSTLRPRHGERFVIRRESGALVLVSER